MARARNIKPGFFTNEDLAEIHPLGRLLFAGLWTLADREGRLEDRPKRIKAAVLPYDDCDIDGLLTELSARGFIQRYQVEEKGYIWIPGFLKHQNPHHREGVSVLPEPSGCLENAGSSPEESGTGIGYASEQPTESPGLEQGMSEESPGIAPEQPGTSRADSLIPDSLIPDSLIPEVKDIYTAPAREAIHGVAADQPVVAETGFKVYGPSSPEYRMAEYLLIKARLMDPKMRPPNMQVWASDIARLMKTENRTMAEIKDMIDFAHDDPFWKKTILTPLNLSNNTSKLAALMKAIAEGEARPPGGKGHGGAKNRFHNFEGQLGKLNEAELDSLISRRRQLNEEKQEAQAP